MKRALLLSLLVLVPSAAPVARAFVQLRTSAGKDEAWDLDAAQPNVVSGRITYYLHPDGTGDLSDSEAFAAVRRAIGSWAGIPDSRLDFEEDPTRPASSHRSADRVNLVRWVEGELGPFTLGSTFPTLSDGYLRDADLLLNDSWFRWSVATPGANGRADVEAVVAHEWGHVLGLDHVSIQGATLFHTSPLASTYFRTLHADEEAAAAALYPAASYATHRAEIRGAVDVAGKSNDRGAHVIAVDALSGEVSVSALTEPDGSFALRGLVPGTYRLLVAPFHPLNALNSYWSSSTTSFVPAPLTGGGGNPGRTTLLVARGGDRLTGATLSVRDATDPLEPDGTTGEATAIEIGSSVAARIESIDDRDHFRFPGKAGQKVWIHVHAAQIGSDVDPIVDLIGPDERTVLRTSGDIRSEFVYGRRVEGPDTDCRIAGYTLPADGDYTIRVRVAASSGWGLASSFYALSLSPSYNAPDAGASEYSADPPAIDAGGEATSLVRVVPRNALGEVLGGGVTVAIESTAGGAVGPVSHLGGGAYAAVVTSPAAPGSDPLTVRMANDDGFVEVPGAVAITYLGPPDASRSHLGADPHRLPADGVSTATVTFVPRDARGDDLGPGRAVSLALEDPGSGHLTTARDAGDGTYAATLTSGPGAEGARVIAMLSGLALALDVPYGYDLLSVVEEVRAEVARLLAEPGTPERSRGKLEKAESQLAAARDALAAPEPDVDAALALVAGAARSLEKAQKKSRGALNVEAAHADLSRAARATARTALDSVVTGGDEKREKQLARAERHFTKGEDALAAGKSEKAVKKYRTARRKAVRI